MNDKELRLMVETRPSETIAYIKKLENEIEQLQLHLIVEDIIKVANENKYLLEESKMITANGVIRETKLTP